jgi:DNA-binding SARP family transcriptional activator
MRTIKFYLFGKPCLELDGKIMNKIEPHKAEELLAFLILNQDQPYSREKLSDLLWEGISANQANSYFRKVLWQLQSALDHLGLNKTDHLIQVNGEWIQINPIYKFWLDVAIFENSFNRTRGILGRELDKEQAQIIKNAVDVYRGELLNGWYQDWCLYERERLENQYLAMLDKLMEYCEVHTQYEEGVFYGETILRYDRAREQTHRRLMRLYYLSGHRTGALRQYQKCVETLREELNVKPTHSTLQLFEMICIDKLEAIQSPSNNDEDKTTKGWEKLVNKEFSNLTILNDDLTKIQTLLAKDIRVIQNTIKGNR